MARNIYTRLNICTGENICRRFVAAHALVLNLHRNTRVYTCGFTRLLLCHKVIRVCVYILFLKQAISAIRLILSSRYANAMIN